MLRIKILIPTLFVSQIALLSQHILLANPVWQETAATDYYKHNTQPINSSCSSNSTSQKFRAIDAVVLSNEPIPSQGGIRFTYDSIEGEKNTNALIKGNVIVENENLILNSPQIIYQNNNFYSPEKFVLQNPNSLLSGKKLTYNLDSQIGQMTDFQFNSRFREIPLQGSGKELAILDKNFYQLKNAEVNTCNPGDDSWYLAAAEINVDFSKNIGVAKRTQFVFKGVPLIYIPWFDFPLNGKRKSGFLSPVAGVSSDNGVELGLPYYLNLAANYDMTLTPRVYSKRGFALDTEFRYLFPNFRGIFFGSTMPIDRVAKKEGKQKFRSAISFQHFQEITPNLLLGIDYNKVSDNNYFKDFGNRTASAENTNLNRQIWLSYTNKIWDGPFSAFLTIQNYQTLQNADKTIDEPYRLEPQLTLKWSKLIKNKAELDVLAQLTRFNHKTKQTGLRTLFYPRLTWDFSNEWGFIRPAFGVHATYYQLDSHWDKNATTQAFVAKQDYSRVLPIFSLDTGLIFERPYKFRSRDFIQTLEPRIFYTYIPNKEQSHLPNFDSEKTDFTFSSLFRENRFSGHDRINAANHLSFGMLSRFYDPKNGAELFRLGIGQRIYFRKDNVSLDDTLNRNRKNKSDILLFAHGQITDRISIQTDLYFNQNRQQYNRYILGLKYNPESGKTFNIRYKYDKDNPWLVNKEKKLEQIDISFQWPIVERYYLVGKYNYSISDKKSLESLFGVEYLSKCQCWGMNAVFQTYVTEQNKRKNAVFFQLNLRGLGGLGVNPFEELYRSIPGFSPKSEVK